MGCGRHCVCLNAGLDRGSRLRARIGESRVGRLSRLFPRVGGGSARRVLLPWSRLRAFDDVVSSLLRDVNVLEHLLEILDPVFVPIGREHTEPVCAPEKPVRRVKPQGPVGLELLLAEELVGRGLVGILGIAPLVVADEVALVSRHRGLDVDQHTSAEGTIVYPAHGYVRPLVLVRDDRPLPFRLADLLCRASDDLPRQVDARAKVDACVALQAHKRGERHRRIGLGIDRYDQPASPLEQFV
jgi:hypothetical protein